METLTIDKPTKTADFLPLNGTDHVEFYVGNAKRARQSILRFTAG